MSGRHTALDCIVAVARRYGVDLSAERLAHEHVLAEGEPPTATLLRIARENGFKAHAAILDWDRLKAQPAGAFPALLRLRNGNTVVALVFRPDTGEVAVADPLADGPGPLMLSREKLQAAWGGETLFLKRVFRLTDDRQPFGLRWFVPELWRQRRLFRDVAIAAFTLYLLALALPVFFQLVIDRVLVHQSYSTLYVLAAGVALALVFEALFGFLRQYLLLYATTRMDLRLSARVFAHLVSLPVAFFERTLTGVVLQHVQQSRRIREFLTGRLFLTILDASMLVVFVPVLILYSPALTALLLAFCAAIAAVITLVIGPFRRRLTELYQAEAERQGLLVETIHGMPTVKASALEARQRKRWEDRVAYATRMHFRVGQISAGAQSATQLIEKLMTVTVIVVGAHYVFDNQLSVGALVAFQMISNRVSGPLVQIVSLVHEYQEVGLAVRMLGEVLNQPAEAGASGRGLTPVLRGAITFERVSFAYVPGLRVIDDVSFHVLPGSIVGVVGPSGSGKTTLARLMAALYPVQDGVVRFDGVPARDIDLVHLRRSIGVVMQETFLFRGTVRENVTAGKPDATLEEVTRAVRLAGADEFIDRLPAGLETPLEENGANLSGGQKQRLAIARALLPDPRIVIFDEATSALDPDSEAIVQRNLAAIARGRTLIIITHRLGTLVGCDTILVMERGRVVDHGRHQDLAGRAGLYQTLWRQQARAYR